jgi:N-methylhydantoinase A/oxoprolinase/acetone carboxylase beta subunit
MSLWIRGSPVTRNVCVGPASAGADPGPACYGRGGPLAVTDLNFFLGRILPEYFPFPLDRAAVEQRLVAEVDGHDVAALRSALHTCMDERNPSVIVAKTTKGKGVSFIEDRMDSHYLPLDQSQYDRAVHEIEHSAHASRGMSE